MNYKTTILNNTAKIELTDVPTGYRCSIDLEWESEDKLALLNTLIATHPAYGDLETTLSISNDFKVRIKRFF